MGRFMLVLTLIAALLVACGGTVLAQSTQPEESTQSSDGQPDQTIELDQQYAVLESGQENSVPNGSLSEAQSTLLSQGYLNADPGTLGEFKDAAEQEEEASPSSNGSTPLQSALNESTLSNATKSHKRRHRPSSVAKSPTTFAGSLGLNEPKVGPSDSTSAIGPDRYIETINDKYGIYNLTDTSPTIGQGNLSELFGVASNSFVTDPQIIWDPTTSRFYYAGLTLLSPTDSRLVVGFSTTDKPTSAADFCHYSISFGGTIPDYPKLGDTQNWLLIGVNSFNASQGTYLGSQLSGVQKPPSGNSCPASLGGGTSAILSGVFTPVPANQTDGNTTGHVVATSTSLLSRGSATVLPLLQVVEGATNLNLFSKPLSVPTYRIPANAQQFGTPNRLDTLDGRNTQAVSAIDPSQGNKVGLWTQHTIFGGGGAEVRWYEIDPDAPSVLRSEELAVPGVYIFNAATSPDRAVSGSTTRFGDSMLLGANFSSATINPGLLLEGEDSSKTDSFATYLLSLTYLADFTCSGKDEVCRWGDYSGMSPYPSTPSSYPHGITLHTNQFVRSTGSSHTSGWGTFNWLVYAS